MDQFDQIQSDNKKIVTKTALLLIILAGVIFLPSIGFFMAYNKSAKETRLEDMKKIGNWNFPDDRYELATAAKTNQGSIIKIIDNQSGNEIFLTDTPLVNYEFLEKDGKIASEFLKNGGMNNYILNDSGKLDNDGSVIYFNVARWDSKKFSEGEKESFLGRMDCKDENKSITIFVLNSPGKYDHERALEFVKTLNCDNAVSVENGNENNKSDIVSKNKPEKTDSDNDGLSDVTENFLRTDYNNPDSDGDGYTDFEEIKNGFNPLKHSPKDKYQAEYYQVIKKEIKSVDEENYFEIFEEE